MLSTERSRTRLRGQSGKAREPNGRFQGLWRQVRRSDGPHGQGLPWLCEPYIARYQPSHNDWIFFLIPYLLFFDSIYCIIALLIRSFSFQHLVFGVPRAFLFHEEPVNGWMLWNKSLFEETSSVSGPAVRIRLKLILYGIKPSYIQACLISNTISSYCVSSFFSLRWATITWPRWKSTRAKRTPPRVSAANLASKTIASTRFVSLSSCIGDVRNAPRNSFQL